TTSFDFSDRFGIPDNEARNNIQSTLLGSKSSYDFATKVTNAAPFNHETYTQFDYYTGKPINSEDPNGLVALGIYDDALDRPTELVVNIVAGTPPNLAFQRRTTFIYADA